LSALSDSYARESLHFGRARRLEKRKVVRQSRRRFGDSPLEVAYMTRWIEIDGGRELHAWRTISQRASD
jgi:hypothetical protein